MRLLAVLCLLCATAAAAPGKVVRVATPELDALPSRGPRYALVTIEVFLLRPDVRAPEIRECERLQAEHPETVRLVYRVIPTTSSSRLHYAVLEAYAEGRFDAFVDALAKQPGTLTNEQLLAVAAAVGVNTDQLAEVIANPPAAFDALLDADSRRQHERFGAGSGVIINGIAISRAALLAKAGEIDRVYAIAKDLALDLLDRGVDLRDLPDALEAASAPDRLRDDLGQRGADPDDVIGDLPGSPVLATPPLDLTGMPSYGPASAEVTVAVLCVPSAATSCHNALNTATSAAEVFGDRVRVVWAPFFDVTRDDAAELGKLADAALCAERVGVSGTDLASPSSPGWDWLQRAMTVMAGFRRHLSAERVFTELVPALHVDERAFAACRARQAGASIGWVEAAVRSGVHAAPSTVIGGRIYPAITDKAALQELLASELEPSANCEGCLRLQAIVPAWRGPAWRGDRRP